MNNKLAKKLKDCGFPQGTEPCEICSDKDKNCPIAIYNDEQLKFPTLEELIDECNCQCFNLDKRAKWASGGQWFCEGSILKEGENDNIKVDSTKMPELIKRGFGKTLKEAVANLWLELNK